MKKVYTDEYGDVCFTDEYALKVAQRVLATSPRKTPEEVLKEDGLSEDLAESLFESQTFNDTVGPCGKCGFYFKTSSLHHEVISDGDVCDGCELDYYTDQEDSGNLKPCKGELSALYVVGQEWLNGSFGRKKSDKMALEYFRRGAHRLKKHGCAKDCAREAGILLEKMKDFENAAYYFKIASREQEKNEAH